MNLSRRSILRTGTAMGLFIGLSGFVTHFVGGGTSGLVGPASITPASPITFSSSASTGTTVATLTANGANPSSCTWTIGGTNASYFQISGSPGQIVSLQTTSAFPTGVVANYTITITASNAYGSVTQGYTMNAIGAGNITTATVTNLTGSTINNLVFELALPIPTSILTSGLAVSSTGTNVVGTILQADLKKTDIGGSGRWQKVVGIMSSLAGNASTSITLSAISGSSLTANPITASQLQTAAIGGTGNDLYDVNLTLTFPNGTTATLDANTLLGAGSTWTYGVGNTQNVGTFRQGSYITEFVVRKQLTALLLAELHITAAKAGTGAVNDASNPILWTRTRVVIKNGYIGTDPAISIPAAADQVYDVAITTGKNTPVSVVTVNGSTPNATLTLGARSTLPGGTQNIVVATTAVSSAVGTWATKTYANGTAGNCCGKAIVDVCGTGLGWITDVIDSQNACVVIPAATAMAASSYATTLWRTMGVYHPEGAVIDFTVTQGTYPKYQVTLTPTYIKSTGLVLNYASNSSTLLNTEASGSPAISALSAVTGDGAHPFARSSGTGTTGGTIRGFAVYESALSDGPHVGPMNAYAVTALNNWASDNPNSLTIIKECARRAQLKQNWLIDETTGHPIGFDKAGVIGGAAGAATNNYTKLVRWNGGSCCTDQTFSRASDMTWLAYLLTGELIYLEGQLHQGHVCKTQSSGNGFTSTIPDLWTFDINNFNTGTSYSWSSANGNGVTSGTGLCLGTPFADPGVNQTTFTVLTNGNPSSGGHVLALPYVTGEAVSISQAAGGTIPTISGYAPIANGSNLPRTPWAIFYIRVTSYGNSTTAATFQLYNTQAQALAGGTTGQITIICGTQMSIVNGRDKHTLGSPKANAGSAQEMAWQIRDVSRSYAASPDGFSLYGIGNQTTSIKGHLDTMGQFLVSQNVSNPNFTVGVGNPRWIPSGGNSPNFFTHSPAQFNQLRLSLLGMSESGCTSGVSDNWEKMLDWSLSDACTWLLNGGSGILYPMMWDSANFSLITDNSQNFQYTFSNLSTSCFRFLNQSGLNGGSIAVTASITAGALATVNFSGSYFNMANASEYVGAALQIGGATGKISTVNSATQCTVTVPGAGDLYSNKSSYTPYVAGTGQPILQNGCDASNGSTVLGSGFYNYPSGSYQSGNGWTTPFLARSAIEVCKQRGIDTLTNYANAKAIFDTTHSFPAHPLPHLTDVNLQKLVIDSRI